MLIKSAAQNFAHLFMAYILSHNTAFLLSLFLYSKTVTSEQNVFMSSEIREIIIQSKLQLAITHTEACFHNIIFFF